jgi:hypothetical protein
MVQQISVLAVQAAVDSPKLMTARRKRVFAACVYSVSHSVDSYSSQITTAATALIVVPSCRPILSDRRCAPVHFPAAL